MPELDENETERFREQRGEIKEDMEVAFDMRERQASAHYELRSSEFRDYDGDGIESDLNELQEEFDIDGEEIGDLTKGMVEAACKNRFMEDHDLTFRPDYVSVEEKKYGGGYTCTIMSNQT